MADLILNEALGRSLVEIQNVEDNSPVAAVLRIHAWVIAAADNALRDAANRTVTTFEAIASVTEATPYTNLTMDETDITITVDDTNDRVDVDYVDQTFTSVAAQTAWTDITVAYDADGSDTDGTTLIYDVYDFVVTPNGGDITIQWNDTPIGVVHRYIQA
jgi:hypothetical protein